MIVSKITFICLCVFLSQTTYSQYSYPVQNYSQFEYKGSNQNWDITKAKDGKLYVANNNGLLEYDGLVWKLWSLPNKTIIRSLLIANDKIYTGSYEEFGYWERNNKGRLKYTSLVSDTTDIRINPGEEFWQILHLNDTIIFRSFPGIHLYNQKNKKFTSYILPSIIISCHLVDEKLFASTLNHGVFVLENNEFKPYIQNKILENTRIISITKTSANLLLVTTALKGCFLIKNNNLVPWNVKINEVIKRNELNRFNQLDNDLMVFGTIKNGVYITNSLGTILYNINRRKGLLNNTILAQCIGKNNDIWLGLDNGISNVEIKKSNYVYNDITENLGAVYDVVQHKNSIYLGSNTGLYRLDKKDKLHFIEGSLGQVWRIQEINGSLICGHNSGTYLLANNKLKLISKYTGGRDLKKIPEKNNIYVQGSYTGLIRFKNDNNCWIINDLEGPKVPIRFVVFEDKYTAWATHLYKGLYRVKFNENYDKIITFKNYDNKGLWANYNIRIYNFKNNIVFYTEHGWQKYEAVLDSIIPYQVLNNLVGKNSYIISEEDIYPIALKKDDKIMFNFFNNNQNKSINIPNNYYKQKLINNFENISKINDSTFALNLYDGFMLINPYECFPEHKATKPVFESIQVNNKYIDIQSKDVKIPFKNNKLQFNVSSAKSKGHFFEYSLASDNTISTHWKETIKDKIDISNLMNGNYVLSVRAIDINNYISPVLFFEFTILPPFYKSVTAKLIYLLTLMLIIFIFYLLHKRKIIEKQDKLRRENAIESEKQLIKFRNEALQIKMKLKTQQLVNTSNILINKNIILQNIKKKLLLHKPNFNDPQKFTELIKKIDHSLGHEDDLKIFKNNFDAIHSKLFKQLKITYPVLSYRDLLTCAFIKMNLTTKEIAQLLNISIRGVETIRYKLRKKLNLSRKDNINSFLQNLSQP